MEGLSLKLSTAWHWFGDVSGPWDCLAAQLLAM